MCPSTGADDSTDSAAFQRSPSPSRDDQDVAGGISLDDGVPRYESKTLGRCLRDKNPIERVLVNRRQIPDASHVFRTNWQRHSSQLIERIPPPVARIPDTEGALHALQHHFPINDDTQNVGSRADGGTDFGRKGVRAAQGNQGGVGTNKKSVQISPSRKRSRSTGASQPGRNFMRPFIPPRRARRRRCVGRTTWATGFPWRVITISSPSSTARITSEKRFFAWATLNSMHPIIAISSGHFKSRARRPRWAPIYTSRFDVSPSYMPLRISYNSPFVPCCFPRSVYASD